MVFTLMSTHMTSTFNSFEDETWRDRLSWSIIILTFNSFEDETYKGPTIRHRVKVVSFNSFEDETNRMITVYNRVYHFQFLWGWNKNKKTTLEYTGSPSFQFLWGWNAGYILEKLSDKLYDLSIPLRMKHKISELALSLKRVSFQFLWGWNNLLRRKWGLFCQKLSIPLRMKQHIRKLSRKGLNSLPFNSFEDETDTGSMMPPFSASTLSIPLRMKHGRIAFMEWSDKTTFNSFEDETKAGRSWGSPAYALSIPLRMKRDEFYVLQLFEVCFQFLWGWNKNSTPWGWKASLAGFQFLWGWNWSTFILSFIL